MAIDDNSVSLERYLFEGPDQRVLQSACTVADEKLMQHHPGCNVAPVSMQVYDDLVFAEEQPSHSGGEWQEGNGSDNPDEEGHCTHEYPDELSTSDEAGSSGGGEGTSLDSSAEDSVERDMW